MKDFNTLLDEEIIKFRELLREDYPEWATIPIITKSKKAEKDRDWSFSTNLKEIFAEIYNSESLEKKFEEIITKFWKEDQGC